jgi:hypothetical protein
VRFSLRIVLAAVLSSWALAGILNGAPRADQRSAPASLEELAQQGVAALNGRRLGDFKQLADSGVDTGWVQNLPPEADPTNPWVAGTLAVDGGHWVVFSLDKMVEMDHDQLYRAEERGGRWVLAANVDEAEPGRHWRIAGHEESVSIDPKSRTARFTDTFRVRAFGPGRPLIFDLGHLYEIESLEAGARVVPYRRAGNLIQVQAAVRSGEPVRVVYHRTFQQPPGPHSNVTEQDALFWADWLPVIAYQPAPSRITIETPATWESIAQGDLEATRRQGERIARTFVNRAPVSFIMAVAGPYTVTRRRVHGYPLAAYMLHDDRTASERGLAILTEALPFYLSRFGPIPWKHYTIVQTSCLVGGAQEGYSFSVYSSAMFPGAAAHELGHSWWGGRVNNTYFGSYWNESLTTYSEDLLNEARQGSTTARVRRLAKIRTYQAIIARRHDLALTRGSTEPLDPVTLGTTYVKGAMVCHMLRRELGDRVFFRTLRRFASVYAGKSAEWDDLARIAMVEAGRPMGWFFEQWTRREGAPKLRWSGVRSRLLPDGRIEVRAVLRQEGRPFLGHITVALESDRDRSTRRIWMGGARTPVRLVVRGTLRRLIADPEEDWVRALEPDEIPANTETLFAGQHPLLVVYGTGGDAAYQKAMRDQAEAQASYWREMSAIGFTELSSIKVAADTAVTDADRKEAHLVLVGSPGTNALAREVAGRLPVHWRNEQAVAIGGRSLTGPGLVIATNTCSPWNAERLLRTWSGSDAKAMGLPWDVNGGGLLALMNAAWVARNGRILAWSDAGTRDHRTLLLTPQRLSPGHPQFPGRIAASRENRSRSAAGLSGGASSRSRRLKS